MKTQTVVNAGEYLLQIESNGCGCSQKIFKNKVSAIKAFNDAWTIEGEITLLQGYFYVTNTSWYVYNKGKAFTVAEKICVNDSFQCECCNKHFEEQDIAKHLDSSDGNVYEMCPACRQFHRNVFEKELEEEYED